MDNLEIVMDKYMERRAKEALNRAKLPSQSSSGADDDKDDDSQTDSTGQ
jgi:hypothetical protein